MPFAIAILCLMFQRPSSDLITSNLDRARIEYNSETEKVSRDFASALRDSIAGRRDEKSKEIIEEQRGQFEKDGKIPTSPLLKTDVSDYKLKMRKAEDSYRRALKKAKSDYTNAKRIEEAEAVEAELSELPSPVVATTKGDQVAGPGGASYRGTKWAGPRVDSVNPGQNDELTLWISTVQEKSLVGFLELFDGRIYKVTGEIDAKSVAFSSTTRPNDKFQQTYKGEIKDRVMTLTFSGFGSAGNGTGGTAVLKLEPRRDKPEAPASESL